MTQPTDTPPAADLQAALARLWKSTPAAPSPDPLPLPPRAIGSGMLDRPCRCGSMEYVVVEIDDDRTRRDCRKCGRFFDWGQWHSERGPTP